MGPPSARRAAGALRVPRPRYFAADPPRWSRLARAAAAEKPARGMARAAARYLAALRQLTLAPGALPLPGPGMLATELCALAEAALERNEPGDAVRALRRALTARPGEAWLDYVAVYDAIAERVSALDRVDALCDLAALFREHSGLPRAGSEAPRLTLEMATLMVHLGAERAAVDLLDGTDGSTLHERFWWRVDAGEAMLGVGKNDLAARFARRALRAAGRGRPREQARSLLREALGAARGPVQILATPAEAALAWLNAYRQGRFEDLFDLYHSECAERGRYRNREHYGRMVRRAVASLGIKPGRPDVATMREGSFEATVFAAQAVRRAPAEMLHHLCWQLELLRTAAGWRVRRCRSVVVKGGIPGAADTAIFRGIEWEG